MGHRADWKQCSVKLVDFLSRRLSSTFRWNGRGNVCLPSRIPDFSKKKKKKKNHGRAGKSGPSGMINNYFFLLGLALSLKVSYGSFNYFSLWRRFNTLKRHPFVSQIKYTLSLSWGASHKFADFSKHNAFRNGGRGSACFGWKITNRTFSKKGNEGNFEYLFYFEDRQRNVRQRKMRKPVQDERAPTLTPFGERAPPASRWKWLWPARSKPSLFHK